MMLISKIKNSNNFIHLCQMIEPLLYCDNTIYLYAKNLEKEKYPNLMKEMNEASE